MLRKLSDSISTVIIDGLKAGTSVVQNAQVGSVAAPQSENESNCEVESAVQGSVTGALNVLSDEACINTHLDKPGVLFNSLSVPVGAKVLAHEYIDFCTLLNSTPDAQIYQLASSNTFGNNISTTFPHLALSPRISQGA